LGWVALLFDADHDRDLDLFFSNGHIYPQVDDDPALHESYKQKNQLFVNDKGKYVEVSDRAGEVFSIVESSRGGACADLDNDGDLDIVVSNQDAKPTYYENRSRTNNHWLMFQLVDTQGAPQALGTRIEAVSGGLTQMREVTSGAAYASQNDLRLNVGLGDAVTLDQLRVTWPDGSREIHEGLMVDRLYLLKRGQEPLEIGLFAVNR
jgi:hypothetical protein